MLVRSPEKATKLERFGVKPVLGSLKDHPLVENLSEKAHVVFSLVRPLSLLESHINWLINSICVYSSSQADSDDLDFMQALLRGLKNRHAKTGDAPVLIHTSGTGQCNAHITSSITDVH